MKPIQLLLCSEIAKQKGRTVQEWMDDLALQELERIRQRNGPLWDGLMKGLGERLYEGKLEVEEGGPTIRKKKEEEEAPPPEKDPSERQERAENDGRSGLYRCSLCKVAKLRNAFPKDGPVDRCNACIGKPSGTTLQCGKCGEVKNRRGFRDGICMACQGRYRKKTGSKMTVQKG